MLSSPTDKRPRSCADWTGPKIFVSVLDSSSLEDATNNFSFQEDPQDSCPAQHVSQVGRHMELVVYCVIGCPTIVLDAVGEWRRWPMRRRRRGRRGAGQEVARGGGRGAGGGGVEKAASQTRGQGQDSPSLAIAYL